MADIHHEIALLRFGSQSKITGSGPLAVVQCYQRIQLTATPMEAQQARFGICGTDCYNRCAPDNDNHTIHDLRVPRERLRHAAPSMPELGWD